MSSWIVQARIRQQCEIILVQFTGSLMHFKMLLAFQHSTYAVIHDLVARAVFLEAAVLLLFISEISPSDTRGKLSLVYCHCSCVSLKKMKIFEGGNTSVL